MEGFPLIRPVTNPAEVAELVAAAKADNHNALAPTHIFRKSGEIVGYASICATPQFHVWFHTQKLKPRESFHLINALENITTCTHNAQFVLVPVDRSSPFKPVMESMGYVPLMESTIYYKQTR